MALLYPSPPVDDHGVILPKKSLKLSTISDGLAPPLPHPSPLQDLSQFATSMVYRIWHSALPSITIHSVFYTFSLKMMSSTAANISPSVVITALLLIQRLKEGLSRLSRQQQHHRPSDQSEFRIWLTALLLADSLLNDNAFTAASWAQVSGFPLPEVVTMKREFMESLGYDLYVSEAQYGVWLKDLLLIESMPFPLMGVAPHSIVLAPIVAPSTPPPEPLYRAPLYQPQSHPRYSINHGSNHQQQPRFSHQPLPINSRMSWSNPPTEFTYVPPPLHSLPPLSCSHWTAARPTLPPMMIHP